MLRVAVSDAPLEMARVREFADKMRNGGWILWYDHVVFDDRGLMVNGRHRCRACVMAGEPFPATIEWGLPSDPDTARIYREEQARQLEEGRRRARRGRRLSADQAVSARAARQP